MLSKNISKILKSSSGFSLIEIIVAMGIMSVVAGLFATSMVQLQKSQVTFEDKNASFSFVSALTGSLLGDQQTCTALLQGTRLNNNPTEFTMSNFSGLGSKTLDLKKGAVISGESDDNPKVKVQGLTIHAKAAADAPSTKVVSNGITYDRKIAVITLSTEIRTPGGTQQGQKTHAAAYTTEAPRTLEVPVYVRSNVIHSCQINMTQTDACSAIGAGVDPSNPSRCKPQDQCFMKGSYMVSKCTPAYGGCLPHIINQVSMTTSCPAKSTRTSTGNFSESFTISCGKKCTQTILQSFEYYICMECN